MRSAPALTPKHDSGAIPSTKVTPAKLTDNWRDTRSLLSSKLGDRYTQSRRIHLQPAAIPIALINLVNATCLHLFNGQPVSEPRFATEPGHRLYPHENNMQTAKALFPILYT